MERKLDHLGRIVVPIELRKTLGWTVGTRVEIQMDGDRVVLKKSGSRCPFCSSVTELKDVKGVRVCQSCIDEIKVGHFWEVD